MRKGGRARRILGGVLMLGLLNIGGALAAESPSSAVPPEEAEVAAANAGAQPLTLLQLLQKGGPLMYPLYVCSLLMLAFGIERGISLRRKKILPPEIAEDVRMALADTGVPLDAASLLETIQPYPSPMTRILEAGLRKIDRPLEDIEKAIGHAGERESGLMRRNCRVLSIVASVSPLLGLLGTVFGMIQAFMTVARREEALGRTELLAAGIYQALVTTAVGLSIAIPALVLYHIFVDKVDQLVTEIDDMAVELVEKISQHSRT